ncbi:MAG TPA: hypothetical protein VG297_04850 [Bryobacteraceae bacterium]|nr:hypothetical protein [Bryobacteraceae bacterium]
MSKQWSLTMIGLLGLCGAAGVSGQTVRTALPGTINYVEGQASINGRALSEKLNENTRLTANQTLSTGDGKVEMLLSPGVFVREGSNSELRLVSDRLVDPSIEVVRGDAMVEVDQKLKDAQVDVLEHGATATILKAGLYRFDSAQNRVEVIDGKLRVTENGQSKELGRGKEVAVTGEPLKTVSFDRKAEDDLYRWSSVRSGYLAEANSATAQNIYMGYGSYWGTGWYWNPAFAAWSWLPGDGFFYSPFGYPFYSPGYSVYAPYRFGARPGFGTGFRGGVASRGFISRGVPARGFAAGGFAARSGGFRGGRR